MRKAHVGGSDRIFQTDRSRGGRGNRRSKEKNKNLIFMLSPAFSFPHREIASRYNNILLHSSWSFFSGRCSAAVAAAAPPPPPSLCAAIQVLAKCIIILLSGQVRGENIRIYTRRLTHVSASSKHYTAYIILILRDYSSDYIIIERYIIHSVHDQHWSRSVCENGNFRWHLDNDLSRDGQINFYTWIMMYNNYIFYFNVYICYYT